MAFLGNIVCRISQSKKKRVQAIDQASLRRLSKMNCYFDFNKWYFSCSFFLHSPRNMGPRKSDEGL